jgi:hypothetical protein
LKEKAKEPPAPEPEPEPTTEVLFLCSFEGCGKTFIDAGALRKHSHIHGERQYVCHYEGCGKVLNLTFLGFILFLEDIVIFFGETFECLYLVCIPCRVYFLGSMSMLPAMISAEILFIDELA